LREIVMLSKPVWSGGELKGIYLDTSTIAVVGASYDPAKPAHAIPDVEAGQFTVATDSKFDLADAARAHERRQASHVHGKIILEVASEPVSALR
jgi:NADPH:quinone reductase-like Zn-dependent oxidoreductase